MLHSTSVALLIRERDLSFFVDNSIQNSDDEDSNSEDEETIDKVCVNINPLTPKSDWYIIFFLHPWIIHWGHEKRENYQELKKLLIVTPILLVSTLGNVWRTVWRFYVVKGYNIFWMFLVWNPYQIRCRKNW